MADFSSHASHEHAARSRKARKLHALVAPWLRPGATVLDVGTGSGSLPAYLARVDPSLDIHAIDVSDQRGQVKGFRFAPYDGVAFPFEAGRFDLVISNHVIEHINDRGGQAGHLREILRVLAPGGVALVACPSRWQFVEPHFRLPALSWLPPALRDPYVRLTGRGAAYDCNPMSSRELKTLLCRSGATSEDITWQAAREFVAEPGFAPRLTALVLATCPGVLLRRLTILSPTMFFLARHA